LRRAFERHVLATIVLAAVAEIVRADVGTVIRGVEIAGNEHTAEEVIRHALGVSPGDPFDQESVPRLEQRVRNLRLFTSVSIQPIEEEERSVVLLVTVQERWTLLPVPVFVSSKGSTGAGLFLLESNLFGRGKQLSIGGVITTQGTNARAAYRDPGVSETPLLFAADFSRTNMTREQYAGSSLVYSYQDQRYDFGARAGWSFSDRLSIYGGWFALLVDATQVPGNAAPPTGPPVRGLATEIEYRDQDYHLYYLTGYSFQARYRQGVSWLASDRSLRQMAATASYSARGFSDHALSLTLNFENSKGDPVIDAIRLGGRPGSRGFTLGGLWAETATTFTAEYQVPVWWPSWGVMTSAAFLDAGLTRWQGTPTNYVAPGVGVRLYLRRIALPALGLDIAQATGMRSPVVSVATGFRF
jgi:outer membrane protein assembly factor BamA